MKTNIIKGGFRRRDLPISPDYRPMYKIGLIILILDLACRGSKSSLSKLHFLVWALKSDHNMASIRMAFMYNNTSKIISWGVEPALNKALLFAKAENLIYINGDKYSLTASGSELSKIINRNNELFLTEKSFLNYIGKKKVTEQFISGITESISNKTL